MQADIQHDRLEKFRIFYNHTIQPELMRLEGRRLRLLFLFLISILIFLGVFILQLLLNQFALSLFLLIPTILYSSFLLYRIQKFRITFKPHIVNLILDFIDDGINYGRLEYDPKKTISKSRFLESNIFVTNPKVYQGEDYIKGSIGEAKFELCELNVREFSRVRDRLNYVFRGVYLCAEFNESTRGEILVLPREFRQYLTRSMKAISLKRAVPIDGFMRNKEFRELFMTFATENASFRDMLSEPTQAALVNYRKSTNKEIYLSFINKKGYIAITEPKDILEPYLFRSNISFELVREFFEDLNMLFRIVEDIDTTR
ncbi:MAG: DUF3137 domain-containing protein [Saprospiraceae bacterium]|nr:DUF3137 domain-containing protein [Saprospiraceae bacterium]